MRVNGWLTQVNELANWQGVVMGRMRMGCTQHMLILWSARRQLCNLSHS